jgi:hypothetical protein
VGAERFVVSKAQTPVLLKGIARAEQGRRARTCDAIDRLIDEIDLGLLMRSISNHGHAQRACNRNAISTKEHNAETFG